MLSAFLANPYVSGLGYIITVVSGTIAIVQTFKVSKKDKEIARLNIEINNFNEQINSLTLNRNSVAQGERSQYFQDNNGIVKIDNRGGV